MKRITKIDGDYFLYFLIFACFLLVGILSFKDYGVSIDEHFHYSNGAHYYNFLKGLFFSNPNSVIPLRIFGFNGKSVNNINYNFWRR